MQRKTKTLAEYSQFKIGDAVSRGGRAHVVERVAHAPAASGRSMTVQLVESVLLRCGDWAEARYLTKLQKPVGASFPKCHSCWKKAA